MNGGEFKGSGLDDITDKRRSGGSVPDWYKNGEYQKIDMYVRRRGRRVHQILHVASRAMPGVRERWKGR